MKELIIKNTENHKIIALVENEELVEKYEEEVNQESIEGNIYIGKVQNVLTGLQSAFINIGEKKNAFIHVKDILPKVDITKEEQTEEMPTIETLIKPGDPIIVEVKREATEHKGAKVSTHISLAGRFIVLMPNTTVLTVSQKIESDAEKNRLKQIAENHLPQGIGAIIRTVAEGISEKEIVEDIDKNLKKWEEIQSKKVKEYPQKLYTKGGILKKTIVDLADSDLDKIIVNTKELAEEVQSILQEIGRDLKVEIDEDCFSLYNIEKQMQQTENRKIWLKCGGFITIDKTEALTAIDVNSGKFIGSKNLEETVTKVNLEAAQEIAKQLRLRDISGIIIIDFIDMHTKEDQKAVVEQLTKFTKKDRSKVQIEEFTKLNLMELTRKHMHSSKL